MATQRLRKVSTILPKRPKLPDGKAAGEPETSAERLRRLVAGEDWRAALKLGASLPRLPEPDRTAIQRGWEALSRPAFARELGRDPERLVEAGKAALRRLFGRTS